MNYIQEASLEFNKLNLNQGEINSHFEHIQEFFRNHEKNRCFRISRHLSLHNGIIKLPIFNECDDFLKHFVAYIPAAGAASRYTEKIQSLVNQDLAEFYDFIEKEGLALPLISSEISSENKTEISAILQMPKALMPCVEEKISFLYMKIMEHKCLFPLAGQVFICPIGFKERFKEELALSIQKIPSFFIEQDAQLSTVRVDKSLSLVKKEGQISLVPAGHGALVKTFPQVKEKFPEAHSIFIRNIDNVNGITPQALHWMKRFLAFHDSLVEKIRSIRTLLHKENLQAANLIAKDILAMHSKIQETDFSPKDSEYLWQLLVTLFNYTETIPANSDLSALIHLFERPVNTFAMVKNPGNTVGGIPVVAETPLGELAMVIEAPHVDMESFEALGAPTYFNPVFVASELKDTQKYYEHAEHPFWIVSKKKWHGQDVYYNETLMYELIGNSKFSNLVFAEIPEFMFNPHKDIYATKGRKLASWMH